MDGMELLATTARMSYFHPLRSNVALEVLTLSLNRRAAVHHVRDALVTLRDLQATGDAVEEFRQAMGSMSPWRESYLYAKGLARDAFPVVSIEVDSASSLMAAEEFFFTAQSPALYVKKKKMDLFLRVDVRDYQDDKENATAGSNFWSRVAMILEQIKSDSSIFQLTMVELELGTVHVGGDNSGQGAQSLSNVLKFALHDLTATTACTFKISLAIRSSSDSPYEPLCLQWGECFRMLCRVGCENSNTDHCNELAVSFSGACSAPVATSFWSAVACSRGYSRLCIDQSQDESDSDNKRLMATYLALTFSTHTNDITQVEWRKTNLEDYEVDAMAPIQTVLSANAELLRVSWDPTQVPTATLDDIMTRTQGLVLHEVTSGERTEVLVPGIGIMSGGAWASQPGVGISRPHSAKLTHLHLEIDLHHPQSQLQASRFFPHFGNGLQILRVDSPSMAALTAEGLLSILQSCPRLRQLFANRFQLPSAPVQVDPRRLVSTNLIKLQLLRLEYPPSPTIDTGATEAFFGTVLPVVGAELEYLELRKPSGIIPFAQAFQKIVRSCAGLFHFKLECLDVQSLDSLVECYRNGTSRVSSLYLLKCPVESASVVRFAEFLSDRACVGARKLGVLHINQTSSELSDNVQLMGLNDPSLEAILAMLEENRSLTELYLGVALRAFKRKFDLYDEQEIPVASESFPIENTLALVGALQSNNLSWNPEVVRMITKFAAQRVRRSVRYDVINPLFEM